MAANKQPPLKGKILVLDFDGTCVKHEYPKIGGDIGAVPYLKLWTEMGGKIVLFTMRSGEQLDEAVEWFKFHNIPLLGVNENPEQRSWTSSPKPYGTHYLDDAAIGAPLLCKDGSRPYINWRHVGKLIEALVLC